MDPSPVRPPRAAARRSFTSAERLRRSSDFNQVLARGRRMVDPAFFIYILRRAPERAPCRMGLVTSRKVGPAPRRNLLKRRVREIFRLNKHLLAPGTDMVFVLRAGGTRIAYRSLENAARTIWRAQGVLP